MRGHRLRSQVRQFANLSLPDLVVLFSQWIDFSALSERDPRRRLFPFQMTFWLFLSQVLAPRMSCAEAVKKAAVTSLCSGGKVPSLNTSGYCQARKRLPAQIVEAIRKQVQAALTKATKRVWLWHGHRVKVVDATHAKTDDTPANRRCFRYVPRVRAGCGFPTLKMLAFFSLENGGLLDYIVSHNRRSEQSLFRSIWKRALEAGDVLLGVRFYCNFASFAKLSALGIHLVIRQNATLSASLRRKKRLGKRDWLCEWERCRMRCAGMSRAQWNALPKTITVRQVETIVEIPGMRTRKVMILTTLLDRKMYPATDFGELYRRRWEIELCFRNIKSAMGMEHIACKTPDMVRKQIAMHFIAYNLIRLLIAQAAVQHKKKLERISFKGAVDAVRQWAPLIAVQNTCKKVDLLYRTLLNCIASCTVPERPGRREPRAVKRKESGYEALTRNRHVFKETSARERKLIQRTRKMARLT